MEKWNYNLTMDIPLSGSSCPLFQDRIEIWSVSFCGGGKFGEKPSEQGWEPTTNSTHKWHKGQESNPGHSGGSKALSPLYHPYK